MNTEASSNDGRYYADKEIARLLGISLERLRNKLCAGSPPPPPRCRNRLWPSQAVYEWLALFTISVTDAATQDSQPCRGGCPTKQEVRLRRRDSLEPDPVEKALTLVESMQMTSGKTNKQEGHPDTLTAKRCSFGRKRLASHCVSFSLASRRKMRSWRASRLASGMAV